MSLFPRPVNPLCSLSQPSKPPGGVGESSDDVMPLVSQQQAECFITSASIPEGLLRAAPGVPGKGMIQKPPPGGGGARTGGGATGGAEENAVPKQSELCPVLLFVLSC